MKRALDESLDELFRLLNMSTWDDIEHVRADIEERFKSIAPNANREIVRRFFNGNAPFDDIQFKYVHDCGGYVHLFYNDTWAQITCLRDSITVHCMGGKRIVVPLTGAFIHRNVNLLVAVGYVRDNAAVFAKMHTILRAWFYPEEAYIKPILTFLLCKVPLPKEIVQMIARRVHSMRFE